MKVIIVTVDRTGPIPLSQPETPHLKLTTSSLSVFLRSCPLVWVWNMVWRIGLLFLYETK